MFTFTRIRTRFIYEVYDGYTYFGNGDILMAKVTPCFENKNIAVATRLLNQVGFGSSEIYVLRTKKGISNRYLFYRLQEDNFMDIATAAMTGAGGLKRVPSDVVNNFSFALPDVKEQQKIANFLDHETAKIDTLIEKQQQLIKLLKEKCQAVISHAVTKGLNPTNSSGTNLNSGSAAGPKGEGMDSPSSAPMRDSGVEWLGEVPEHRTVARAKFVSNIFVPQRNKPVLNESIGVAWATMEDMKGEWIYNTQYFVSETSQNLAGSKVLPAGSVIASCVGNFGTSSINKIEVIINQQLQAFIPTKIVPEFLRELVSISKNYFELVGTAATLVYVNQQGFENLPIVLPSEQEQKAICLYLRKEKENYNKLINKCEGAIKLMQERRTALISATVTGKIDVCNWEAA